MRTLRFLINLVLLVLPLIILCEWARLIVGHAWQYLNTSSRLANAVSVEATRQLGREVHVGSVRFTGNLWSLAANNNIELGNVSVADVPSSGDKSFLRADKISFSYSLSQLLLTKDPDVPLINGLQLVSPQVHLFRNTQGEWNFAGLIKPQSTTTRPGVDKVTFRNGVLIYQDRDFPHTSEVVSRSFEGQLTALNGVVQIRPDKSVAFDVFGGIDPVYGRDFHAIGIYHPAPRLISVRVAANALHLPAIGARTLSAQRVRIASGQSDVDLNVLYDPEHPQTLLGRKTPVSVSGHVRLTDLTATGSQVGSPLEHVNGTADVTGDSLLANLSGQYAGTSFQVQGKAIGLTEKPALPPHAQSTPAFSVTGDLAHADIGRMLRAVPPALLDRLPANARQNLQRIAGEGSFRFQALGTLQDPILIVSGIVSRARWGNFTGEDVTGEALYQGQVLSTDLRGQFARGDAAVRARIELDAIGRFQLEAHVRKLDLAHLAVPARVTLRGSSDIDVSMRGQRGRTPSITAQAQVYGVSINKVPINTLYAHAQTQGRDLMISMLRAQDTKGYVVARGKVNLITRGLDINLDADSVDLSAIAGLLQKPSPPHRPTSVAPAAPSVPLQGLLSGDATSGEPLQGLAYLRTHISGTVAQPRLVGRVSAFGLQANNIGVDKVVADLDLTRDRLLITDGKAQRYLGLVTFSGMAVEPFKPNPSVRFTFGGDNLDVADLLHLGGADLSQLAVTGTLYGRDITVEGTPKALTIAPFTVSVQNATLNGQAVTDAGVQAKYDGTNLDILNATAKVANGALSASGTVSRSGDLNLSAQVKGVELETVAGLLPNDLPYDVQGRVSVDATIRGTTHAPEVALTADTEGLAVDGYPIGHVHGTGGFADNVATLRDVVIAQPLQGSGQVHIGDLAYNTKTTDIAGHVDWSDLSIQRLRELLATVVSSDTASSERAHEILGQITGPLDGVVSGTLQLSGNRSHPRGAVDWKAENIRINNYPITLFSGKAIADDTRLQVPQATMTSRDASIEIDAKDIDAVYDGDLSGEISAYKVDLGFLQRWIQQIQTNPDAKQNRVTAQIGGEGDFGVVASGKTKSPQLDVSINLRKVTYLDPKQPQSTFPIIEHIDMDHSVIKEGSITGSLRILTTDTTGEKPATYDLAAHGSLGFSWTPPYIPADAALDLETGLDSRQPITLPFQALSFFAPYALAASNSNPGLLSPRLLSDSDGTLSLNASVTQTLNAPLFAGEVDVQAKRLKLRDYQTGLSDVSGVFDLKQDRIAVRQGFKARSQVYVHDVADPKQVGSPIQLTGELPLGFGEDAGDEKGQITLSTDKLVYNEAPLPGATTGSARGEARVNLNLAGTAKELTVGGDITLHDSQVALPSQFSQASTPHTPQGGYPKFALAVHLDQNNRLVNPQLNARITGNVNLSGSLSDPRLQGLLSLEEGRLTLPTQRFTILTPSTISLLYPVYEQGQLDLPSLQITANVQAQTYLTATSVDGTRKRYLVTVTAKGPLSGMAADPVTGAVGLTLSFATDPPDLAGSQLALNQRVTGLLAGADSFNMLGRNPTQALTDQLTNVFTGSVLPGIFDRTAERLGFETLELGYDPIQRLNLTITRHLGGPLYASYFRTLTADALQYDFKLSLRFKTRYQVSYDFNDLNIQSYLLEGVWHF